jgi:hypothetical protein
MENKVNLQEIVKKLKSEFTEEQIALALGGALGDTSVDCRNKNVRFVYNHGIKQKAYCIFKANVMEDYVKTPPKKVKNGGYGTFNIGFSTVTNSKFNFIRDICVKQNPQTGQWEKNPNQNWMALMGLHAFSFYFMDDGSLNGKRVRFNSHAYTWAQNTVILNRLEELGFSGKIYTERKKDGRKFYFIELNTESSRNFLNKTRKYAHSDLIYKWDLPELKYINCAICGQRMVETQYHRQSKYPSCSKPSCKKRARKLAKRDYQRKPENRARRLKKRRERYYSNHEEVRRKKREYERKRRQDPEVRARINANRRARRKRKKAEKELLINMESGGGK